MDCPRCRGKMVQEGLPSLFEGKGQATWVCPQCGFTSSRPMGRP